MSPSSLKHKPLFLVHATRLFIQGRSTTVPSPLAALTSVSSLFEPLPCSCSYSAAPIPLRLTHPGVASLTGPASHSLSESPTHSCCTLPCCPGPGTVVQPRPCELLFHQSPCLVLTTCVLVPEPPRSSFDTCTPHKQKERNPPTPPHACIPPFLLHAPKLLIST